MKTKDLMEFLRQFNPDSKVYFDITMFNEKKVFMVESVALGEIYMEDVPGVPVIHLDLRGMVEMPEEMVQFWKSKLAEAKVQE